MVANETGRARGCQEPAYELVASSDARSPDQERAGFHLPSGFEAQLVAAEPEIAKPMNLAFDDKGRLWVTSSYEYPFPANPDQAGRDKVTILGDFGPDGRARRSTTFADGLNIPIGVLPLSPRDALVYSIPNIYHMIDDDGDGRADRREVFFQKFGFQDTHGMASAFTFGFDGWVYACHGFSNTSKVHGRDGETVIMQSGNTYRLRPDGSHLEQRTWGQVNPFGLCFDPLGNLYSCDCHSRPIYQLLPGGYYPSFGKPDDGLGYAPEMMTHDHASTGISGIASLASDTFPTAFRDNILIGNVVTSRINRDHLEWRGSTPVAVAEPDFLVSDDPWFRPVDIELGPDGAIYVADFYNKIIGHYEVPLTHPGRDRQRGRIWRIAYTGKDVSPVPVPGGLDVTAGSIEELIAALGHPNLTVRMRATKALVDRGDSVAADVERALTHSSGPSVWVHGAWVLERLGRLPAPLRRQLAQYDDPSVRVHTMRILAESADLGDGRRDLAVAGLGDSNPLVRRCAAEALGRHPGPEFIRPLLEARHAADPRDTHLTHVVRMALRDQFRDGSSFPGPEALGGYSEADRRAIADVATGVPSLASARFLLDHIRQYPEPVETRLRYEQHVARHGNDATDSALVGFARGEPSGDLAVKARQLRAIHQGLIERGAPLPEAGRAWARELIEGLAHSPEPGHRQQAMELAGVLRIPETRDLLLQAARSGQSQPEPVRAQALAALVALDPAQAIEPLREVLGESTEPIGLREQAVNLLGQSGRPEARKALLEAIPTVPTRLQSAMAVWVAADREGALALLAAMESGKVAPRILLAPPVGIKLHAAGVPEIEQRIAALREALPPSDPSLQDLVQARQARFRGDDSRRDLARGATLFSQKCAACHQLGGQGARVGPQLDGIGIRGPERLMEDILDPNRNIDQAFRTTTLGLSDGRVLSGLLLREEGAAVVLANAEGKEITVPKDAIDERTLVPLSPMPANFTEQLAEPEFFDLIAYLLTKREQAKP
jgi:putative membrane-bound dehydrogenase-like protein